jgi:hypothetical protein
VPVQNPKPLKAENPELNREESHRGATVMMIARVDVCWKFAAAVLVVSGCSGTTERRDEPRVDQAQTAAPPVVHWAELHMRNGDHLWAMLLTREFEIETDYGKLTLPEWMIFSVYPGEGEGSDTIILKQHQKGGTGDSNKVTGELHLDAILVRLQTGQEFELQMEQIKSLRIHPKQAEE